MAKKKNFSLKKEYSLCWDYIKESKKYINIIIGIFFLSALIGFVAPMPETLYNEILKYIQELLEQTAGMNTFQLTEFIFLNNIQSSFFGLIFGVFLGIVPIIASVANGYLLGFVSYLSVSTEGFFSLWRLLPHGIPELIAVFISLGLGLRFGTFIFEKNKAKAFRNYFWNSLRVFFYIVLPLLILAAIIEGVLISFLR